MVSLLDSLKHPGTKKVLLNSLKYVTFALLLNWLLDAAATALARVDLSADPTMSDRTPRQARVDLSADPLVYFIDDFADEDSCEHLIRQARPSLGGAEVQTRRGSAARTAIRRASSCWLAARGDEALEHLEDAICAELGAPRSGPSSSMS
ncbi:procollagen-proline 4-dioxygenase [Aureococcus anophagefferens]|nr:procollagen-proline 4-dioxygenase [Aureococcus anophagefferens]